MWGLTTRQCPTASALPTPLNATGPPAYLAELAGVTGAWQARANLALRGAQVIATDAAGRLYMGDWFDGPAASVGAATVTAPYPTKSTGYLARLAARPLDTHPAAVVGPGLQVWPNPTESREVWISGPAAGQAVAVWDTLGRRVGGGTMPGSGALRLALPNSLPAGLYVVHSGGQSQKLIIQ